MLSRWPPNRSRSVCPHRFSRASTTSSRAARMRVEPRLFALALKPSRNSNGSAGSTMPSSRVTHARRRRALRAKPRLRRCATRFLKNRGDGSATRAGVVGRDGGRWSASVSHHEPACRHTGAERRSRGSSHPYSQRHTHRVAARSRRRHADGLRGEFRQLAGRAQGTPGCPHLRPRASTPRPSLLRVTDCSGLLRSEQETAATAQGPPAMYVSLRRLGGASRSGRGRLPQSCGWSCAPAAGRSSPSACGPRSSMPPTRPTTSAW